MKASKKRRSLQICFLLSLTLGLTAITGCDSTTLSNSNTAATTTATPPPSTSANSTPPPASGSAPSTATTSKRASSGATGTINVNPNPIPACEASGMAAANLAWNFAGAQMVEVRMGAPDGTLIAQAGAQGTKTTGKFVGPGTVFYLQDVTNGLPRTPANTMATVTVSTTTNGCR